MGATSEIRQKIDLVFEKEGPARFYSHHDLMRFFERALRRARLPCRLTQGFNPKPRMVFLTPLSLGIASSCEHLELEFTEPVPPHAVRDALEPFLLPGMRLAGAARLPKRRRGRAVNTMTYLLAGFPEDAASFDALERAVEDLRSRRTLLVERFRKKEMHSVDIAPSVASLRREGGEVTLVVRKLAEGTARPDEIVRRLAEHVGCDPWSVRIRKTAVELAW
ncbi:MAG: TIGR03936 family radical SAM-associated protein [Planctomycetota bacterium]